MSMYIKAEEAESSWCPYARLGMDNTKIVDSTYNRRKEGAIPKGACCMIDFCMKWEWRNEANDNDIYGRCTA